MKWLAVGLGGWIGAWLRYAVGQAIYSLPLPGTFPWGTLLINWGGCFFLGWLFAFTAIQLSFPPALRLFLGTGVTGSFTTFSTFSFEAIQLFQAQRFIAALIYIFATLLGGMLLTALGMRLAQKGGRKTKGGEADL